MKSVYKVLLFKVSSCNQCKKQEILLKSNNIDYVPCELFKNRLLARVYRVTDVPTIVVLDSNSEIILKYDNMLNKEQLEKIKLLINNQ